jgi:hypothetical protein
MKGTCIGFGQAGGGNHQAWGMKGGRRSAKSFQGASEMSAVASDCRRRLRRGWLRFHRKKTICRQSLLWDYRAAEIVNDGANGLISGTSRGIG